MNMITTSPQVTLKEMFIGQRVLLEHYKKLEDLPDYPCELDLKQNQEMLRDFSRRFTEELSEAFEELTNAYSYIDNNKPEEAKESIKAFNVEIGDCWHFLLEILLFSGIDEHSIYHWIVATKREQERFTSILHEGTPLKSLLVLAQFFNEEDGKPYQRSDPNSFNVFSITEIAEGENFQWMGARKLSGKIIEDCSEFSWYITHIQNKAMNCLKTKKWHQSDKTINIIAYKEKLMDWLIMFIRYMVYLGKEEKSIWASYYLKNLENRERITNGY